MRCKPLHKCCSLLLACSIKCLCEVKAVSSIWTEELASIIHSEDTKLYKVIQGGGEKEEPVVLWKHGLDAPQTACRKITDPFRFCQFWREFLLASKPSAPPSPKKPLPRLSNPGLSPGPNWNLSSLFWSREYWLFSDFCRLESYLSVPWIEQNNSWESPKRKYWNKMWLM